MMNTTDYSSPEEGKAKERPKDNDHQGKEEADAKIQMTRKPANPWNAMETEANARAFIISKRIAHTKKANHHHLHPPDLVNHHLW